MTARARSPFLPLMALAALFLGFSACTQRPTVPIDAQYPVTQLDHVGIAVEDGSVTIGEGKADVIVVRGEMAQDLYDFSGEVAAGQANIRLLHKRRLVPEFGQRPARLEVLLPPGARLDVETSNGGIEVTGGFTLGTLQTSNGRVVSDGAAGNLTVRNSNGDVRINEHSGTLDVKTSNAAITVSGQQDGKVTLVSSNGRIEYHGAVDGGAEHSMETSNGSIEVELLGGQPSVMLDAHTSNGTVASRYALLESVRSDGELRGRIGEGATRLVLRTSNASIEVR